MTHWDVTLTTAVFATVTLLTFYLGRLTHRKLQARSLRKHLESGRAKSPAGEQANLLSFLLHDIILPLGRLATPAQEAQTASIRQAVRQAGYHATPYCPVQAYFGLRLLAALLLGGIYLAWLLVRGSATGKGLLQVFLPLAAGYYLPALLLYHQAKIRRQKISQELPDILDLLRVCLTAGLSLDSALYRVSRELKGIAPVLSKELAQYFLEIHSGLPRKMVLTNLAKRNDVNALTGVVNVLLQSSRLGTDVTEALAVYADSLRHERLQKAEEQGAKVAVKLTFPMILLIMPALLLVVVGPAMINLLGRLSNMF